MRRPSFLAALPFVLLALFVFPFSAFPWPIPDTGQTKCYDDTAEIPCPLPGEAFYGQDGNYLINPSSYTKLDLNGNDLPDSALTWAMVRDNVTGLIWEVKKESDGVENYADPRDPNNTYTWYDSNPATNGGDAGTPGDGTDTEDFIAALNAEPGFGGCTDWRLPTREELRSIVDCSVPLPGPAIKSAYFGNTVWSYYYWSSSTYAGYAGYYAWGVNFSSGYDDYLTSKSDSRYVRAVRGGQVGSGLFGNLVINDTDTVTDKKTGLMWNRKTDDNMLWEQALAHCESMTTGGYEDWRLPTIKELASIVDLGKYYPSIDIVYFLYSFTVRHDNMTSSTYTTHPFCAWSVHFGSGAGGDSGKSYGYSVRAVRGGQAQSSDHLVISTPRQASFWNIDSAMSITWDTPPEITGNVKISISYDGGRPGSFQTIAASTSNDGQYTWTVASRTSHNCMLKIEPLSDPSKGTTQGLFTILGYLQSEPASLGLEEPALPDDAPETKSFKIFAADNPGGDIELELASANPGEFSVSPDTVTITSANWNTGVEVTLTPEYDGVADGDQITQVLASTTDPLAPFQTRDYPLVQVIVQDADTRTTLRTVSPAFGQAGQPLTVMAEGTGFTDSTAVYILPEGGSATQITPVTRIGSTTLSFTIPARTTGNYNLKAGGFELKNAVTFADSSAVTDQQRKKAVIVSGGGPYADNGFWLATDKCATHAYKTLNFLGYDPDSVQFLSGKIWSDMTGDGENDVDADATAANLQAAIGNLTGANTDELLLYLVGPGSSGKFQFGSDASPEYLAAATLDAWLDGLQTKITGPVVVILDVCQAGSFLAPLAAENRVVVVSAKADERAWYLNDGELSFSYRLFDQLLEGPDLYDAFTEAENLVGSVQTPLIDTDGDGLPDDLSNKFNEVENVTVGRGRVAEDDPPSVGAAWAVPDALSGTATAADIKATDIDAPNGLSQVWARITPPTVAQILPNTPLLALPTIKLLDWNTTGTYEGAFSRFTRNGVYKVEVYAVDKKDHESLTVPVTVTQNDGILPGRGDMNADTCVTLADAIFVLKIFAGEPLHPAPNADYDQDGRTELADAVYILQRVAELREE